MHTGKLASSHPPLRTSSLLPDLAELLDRNRRIMERGSPNENSAQISVDDPAQQRSEQGSNDPTPASASEDDDSETGSSSCNSLRERFAQVKRVRFICNDRDPDETDSSGDEDVAIRRNGKIAKADKKRIVMEVNLDKSSRRTERGTPRQRSEVLRRGDRRSSAPKA